jgi:hypothetical protein
MGKYAPLKEFLEKQRIAEVPMTFAKIEKILAFPLPDSAVEHRPWWANEARGHVHAKSWLDAGYETAKVDMAAKKLVFKRRARSAKRIGIPERHALNPTESSAEKKSRRSPLFGALKGTFTIQPGYDLTQPVMPEWADSLAQDYGPDLPR